MTDERIPHPIDRTLPEVVRAAVVEAIAAHRTWIAVQTADPTDHAARHAAADAAMLAERRAIAKLSAWIASEAAS